MYIVQKCDKQIIALNGCFHVCNLLFLFGNSQKYQRVFEGGNERLFLSYKNLSIITFDVIFKNAKIKLYENDYEFWFV